MSPVDKAALFVSNLEEDDVEIAAGTVRVRALTRFEAGQVQQRTETDAKDRLTMTYGMVAPPLTESEAGDWMKTGRAGDIVKVCTRIAELSGLLESSPKATFPDAGGEPEPGV